MQLKAEVDRCIREYGACEHREGIAVLIGRYFPILPSLSCIPGSGAAASLFNSCGDK